MQLLDNMLIHCPSLYLAILIGRGKPMHGEAQLLATDCQTLVIELVAFALV